MNDASWHALNTDAVLAQPRIAPYLSSCHGRRGKLVCCSLRDVRGHHRRFGYPVFLVSRASSMLKKWNDSRKSYSS